MPELKLYSLTPTTYAMEDFNADFVLGYQTRERFTGAERGLSSLLSVKRLKGM
jgi:hypothetical protein